MYWPRTTSRATSSTESGRSARSTLAFSSRIALASNAIGGSIAISAKNWNMWFCTMSRIIPASSK